MKEEILRLKEHLQSVAKSTEKYLLETLDLLHKERALKESELANHREAAEATRAFTGNLPLEYHNLIPRVAGLVGTLLGQNKRVSKCCMLRSDIWIAPYAKKQPCCHQDLQGIDCSLLLLAGTSHCGCLWIPLAERSKC